MVYWISKTREAWAWSIFGWATSLGAAESAAGDSFSSIRLSMSQDWTNATAQHLWVVLSRGIKRDLCQLQLLGHHWFSYFTPVSVWVSRISQQFWWNVAKGFCSCPCQASLIGGDGARNSSGSHGHRSRQIQILALCQTTQFWIARALLPESLGREFPHTFSWLPKGAALSCPLQVKLRNLHNVWGRWGQGTGKSWVFWTLLPIPTLVLVVCKFALSDTVIHLLLSFLGHRYISMCIWN